MPPLLQEKPAPGGKSRYRGGGFYVKINDVSKHWGSGFGERGGLRWRSWGF